LKKNSWTFSLVVLSDDAGHCHSNNALASYAERLDARRKPKDCDSAPFSAPAFHIFYEAICATRKAPGCVPLTECRIVGNTNHDEEHGIGGVDPPRGRGERLN
jgi:hypothetical protein